MPYGAERVAIELAARLPSRGFRTKLISLFGGDGLHAELRERNVPFKALASSHAVSRVELAFRLVQLLREDPPRGPSIVHTHLFGPDFWTTTARLLVGSQAKHIAFVSTAHNVDRDDSTMRRFARRWCMRRMNAVAAISEDVARYVRDDLGVRGDRVRMIPNGVDMDQIVARPQGRVFASPARILMVGRLEEQKGHATALRALAGVSAPWQLEIAGAGSLLRDLKETAEKLGIASRVRFLGQRNDIPALLRDADLLLFPSRWEGMGITLVEALAVGVPILASDLPALRDLLPRSNLIDPTSPEDWTAAITSVLANPEPALERAQRLAPEARKRYDIDGMVDRYVTLYRDLIL